MSLSNLAGRTLAIENMRRRQPRDGGRSKPNCRTQRLSSVSMSYSKHEKARATAWKRSTRVLPDEAKSPSPYVTKDGTAHGPPYDFCLPAEHAALSLLPEVRGEALALFADLGIPWHAAVDGGPSNHLLSSQVQCVNALGQMVTDPQPLRKAFGDLLGTAEVLQIEPGRYLTFEYIGPTDYFDEAPGGIRTRGAHCTSVDAAFLHRTHDDIVELVLIEWKYTESYRVREPDARRDAVRSNRYWEAVRASDGPVRGNILAFEHLLDEPFYQLVRQQLLAHALERSGAEGASRVRLVHVLPADNEEYQASLARPEHRALGSSVSAVWGKLLRHEDRFLALDSALFLDREITSREYILRYAKDVVFDQKQLLDAIHVDEVSGVEDWLCTEAEFDGDVICRDDEVELIMEAVGTALPYPFTVTELLNLAEELAVEV